VSRIDIQNLTKTWGSVTGVDQVSFTVPEKSLTVLLGPSGCGKSTVLRLIAGLETVSSGTICIGDKEITHEDPARRGVSMVFQSYALFPHLSVRENILFGLKVRQVPKSRQQERLLEAARMVGLLDLLDRRPSQLSGGQRQRTALARAIVSRRRVCLMDEPLSNLDAKLRAEMRDEIHRLQKQIGLTMIYVTHDQVEAMTMADQVILLNSGQVEQAGPPHALYDRPDTIFAARFMGSPPMNLLTLNSRQAAAALADTPSDREMEIFHGHQGVVGVRPEHVCIGDTGLPARIVATDYLGSETIVRIRLDDQVLFARTGKRIPSDTEARVHVSWPKGAVCLFDKTGRRLSEDVL
jgi:sn-glycerol 3-phosphate transport system ATP-binding protein